MLVHKRLLEEALTGQTLDELLGHIQGIGIEKRNIRRQVLGEAATRVRVMITHAQPIMSVVAETERWAQTGEVR